VKINKSTTLLIIGVLVLALGACERETPGADDNIYGDLEALDPSGNLVIYWHALTGADEDRLLEIIDDFNASNAWGITVVGEYQGELDTLYEKVLVGVPTDQLPDLVMTDLSLAAAYATEGVAVPLSPYLESSNWGLSDAEREDFYPSALVSDQLPQFDQQVFSFPLCRSLQVLHSNADWLKELGYENPPETWDELREVACAASNPMDGLYGFEFGMDSSLFTSLLATQNIPILDPTAEVYTLGGEQGQAALQLLQDLINDSCALWETETGIVADFTAGTILFAVGSTDELPTYQRIIAEGASFAWNVSGLPYTTNEPLVGVYSTSTTILRRTPEKQLAAWLLVKWLAEPTQQARWALHTGCFPIRRAAFEEMQDFLEEHPQYNAAAQLLENEWVTEPGVTAYPVCRAEIGRMLYAVTAGESVTQWFSDTLAVCNQSLVDETE
jgi:multiple sugar transport system substrate-binding protein/sn-glycerol 3-phosphate transport system substrate-binding protein